LPVKLALGGKFSQAGLREEATQLTGWQNVIEYGFVNREQAKEMLEQSKIGLVLLHPIINYQDALPVKLFEFMAAGIPVIASNLRLQKQIVEENNCGIVVDIFNIKVVQEAILFLINNPEQAKAMGNNGRKAVEEKFSWGKEEEKLIAFYKSSLLIGVLN
jgi:glycosyltransferase involved in cell wall biosynthesis